MSWPPGGATGRPVPTSELVILDGQNDDLDALLDRLINKLRGDGAQFTRGIQQISSKFDRLMGDAFEQIRCSYAA